MVTETPARAYRISARELSPDALTASVEIERRDSGL